MAPFSALKDSIYTLKYREKKAIKEHTRKRAHARYQYLETVAAAICHVYVFVFSDSPVGKNFQVH